MSKERLYIFDTTLRDGAQTQGVDFSLEDKEKIALALDNLGVDYIEAGWPGANPTDTEFFQNIIEEDKYGICKHINSGRLNLVLGLNDRVNEYLRSSDFLLLPTRKEAFGAVLIEALASGAIPIATRIEGVTDSFLNNSNSLLCENTFASFKETFEEALELKDKVRKEIREQGIKDAQAFSLENISSRYDKMFYDVLKND